MRLNVSKEKEKKGKNIETIFLLVFHINSRMVTYDKKIINIAISLIPQSLYIEINEEIRCGDCGAPNVSKCHLHENNILWGKNEN
jgi:hypothetical protein